jgi:parvulin-like peptidyl-prolyl isomerase
VVIERVIAVVDRTPITLWELHRRLAPQLATLSRSKPVTAVKERSLAAALLEQLIDERIVALRAAELGLAVGEQEVDRAAALVAEQSRISVEQLYAHALSDAYLDRERYRDELRRQLLTARVLQIELANAPKHGSSAERMQISQSRFMKAERKRLRVRVLVSW